MSTGFALRLLVASVSSPPPAAIAPQTISPISAWDLRMMHPPHCSSSHGHRLDDSLRCYARAPGDLASRLGGLRLDEVQEELVGREEAGAHMAHRGPLG